ncbi:6,7-dimethyl-8-ribityllumazine synthase subunit [Capsaspora owczarzaki ATCC 30864]|uniref:6,7-dimethyl-8-ribityllumazine synthase n=1 Tax=Capsaspora owczarzaki (strain ATCC 30864) TaxID=595528 RepID=A0A0D2U1U8_CAPO3|nr:6,7-dimethyl-8-ribityllumazine synthase subunit [Capsaspora owczarzaki ATCC 30864]KJE89156.1 6,7-dimethyl-8-ribityllumazine synthase subunit [Capsaspora owczarzaki ATCC 30864]|eukprot:XP_004365556.1 6,7-dimethyl-8-ribityllumazine synthase subunit [Capsaspora owczarzaki ATCC 30864]
MATAHKGVELPTLNGRGLRIGIVRARWNPTVIDALNAGCRAALLESGVAESDIVEVMVPGSYELPFAASVLLNSADAKVDAVVCLGCLIKGETMHFEYICEAVTQGIMRLNLDSGKPVMFGVLACLTMDQALARAGLGDSPSKHNHGIDWGKGAVEMALLRTQFPRSSK